MSSRSIFHSFCLPHCYINPRVSRRARQISRSRFGRDFAPKRGDGPWRRAAFFRLSQPFGAAPIDRRGSAQARLSHERIAVRVDCAPLARGGRSRRPPRHGCPSHRWRVGRPAALRRSRSAAPRRSRPFVAVASTISACSSRNIPEGRGKIVLLAVWARAAPNVSSFEVDRRGPPGTRVIRRVPKSRSRAWTKLAGWRILRTGLRAPRRWTRRTDTAHARDRAFSHSRDPCRRSSF
jgi:hypothetical protein